MEEDETLQSCNLSFKFVTREEGIQCFIFLELKVNGTEKQLIQVIQKKKDNQYCQELSISEGILIYIKKHSDLDSDYSQGFNKGVTINEAYLQLQQLLQDLKIAIKIDENIAEDLKRFKEIITFVGACDFTAVAETMPELEDFLQFYSTFIF